MKEPPVWDFVGGALGQLRNPESFETLGPLHEAPASKRATK